MNTEYAEQHDKYANKNIKKILTAHSHETRELNE